MQAQTFVFFGQVGSGKGTQVELLVDFLKKAQFCFIDLNFTANMENDLDLVSNNKQTKEKILDAFYKRLLNDIDNAKKIKSVAQVTTIPCPDCGKMLLKKNGKFGAFFGCEDRKNCGFVANIDEKGQPVKKQSKIYGPDPCPLCTSKMIKRKSKYGSFYGCENYPTCRGMRSEDGIIIDQKSNKKQNKKAKVK